MEYENEITLPKHRIAVLIGHKGETKQRIENETGVKIKVNSRTGTAVITRTDKTDPLLGIKAIDIIRAIACGFSPEKAFKLLSPNRYLEVVDLEEHSSTRDLHRIKSRIIGTDGKVRKGIENSTGTCISVSEKTVGIIGDAEGVRTAKEAVLKLVEGASHSSVFRFLEKHKR